MEHASKAASAEIQRTGRSATAMLCDVTNEEQFRSAITAITALEAGTCWINT